MKTKKGYKVVTYDRVTRQYLSLSSLGQIVSYHHKRFTKRPKDCGPLAVFKTLRDAWDFAPGDPIFKIEYLPSIDTRLWTAFFRPDFTLFSLPAGTRFADKVMLIKKVK